MKRFILLLLCFVLLFSVSVFAENEDVNNAPTQEWQRDMNKGSVPSENFNGQPPERAPQINNNESETPQENNQNWNQQMPNEEFGGKMPFENNMNNETAKDETPKSFTDYIKEYITPIISVILLAFAFVFVIFYKRNNF